MNKFIINRVLRSIDENIILIFYTTQRYGYLFYVSFYNNLITNFYRLNIHSNRF